MNNGHNNNYDNDQLTAAVNWTTKKKTLQNNSDESTDRGWTKCVSNEQKKKKEKKEKITKQYQSNNHETSPSLSLAHGTNKFYFKRTDAVVAMPISITHRFQCI